MTETPNKGPVRIILAIVLAVAIAAAMAPKAEAHRVPEAQARAYALSKFRPYCGNGATWICNTFPMVGVFDAVPYKNHSWSFRIGWRECSLPTVLLHCRDQFMAGIALNHNSSFQFTREWHIG